VVGASVFILAIATIVFSWVYLDIRLDLSPILAGHAKCKAALGTEYVGQICQAMECGQTACKTDTTTGDAHFCGAENVCYPCPVSAGVATEGQNYLSGKTTLECTEANLKEGCEHHCEASGSSACLECSSIVSNDVVKENLRRCKGWDENAQKYLSRKSCGGYPWDFNAQSATEPNYLGNLNLLVCGRPMYAAVCYDWGDSATGGVGSNQIDTSPLGLLKNWKYGGGVPATIAASFALLVAIPTIINGVMAMINNQGGVNSTSGLSIGFGVMGFCASFVSLIVLAVLAGTSSIVEVLFAIFNGFQGGQDSNCPVDGACFESIKAQESLSGVVRYYFNVLTWMTGFTFALSLLQVIFAIVVCVSYKKKN